MDSKVIFSGDLKYMNLTDILKFFSRSNKTGVLRIRNHNTALIGTIYFSGGNPVNAQCGTLVGLDAIYHLFTWTEGGFQFDEERIFVEQLIKEKPNQIILNAMKRIDRGRIRKTGPSLSERTTSGEDNGYDHGEEDLQFFIKGYPIDYIYILEEQHVRNETKIVTEGSYGNWIWVVLEGMVKVTKRTSNGEIGIAKLGEGCFVGTLLSLFHGTNRRSATVTATGDVVLGLLDNQRLSLDFSCLSHEFRDLLKSYTRRLIKVTDQFVKFSLIRPQTNHMMMDKKTFTEEISATNSVFAIAEGEACVARETREGIFPILTLEKEDFFGPLPFMDVGHEHYEARIFAQKNLAVKEVDMAFIEQEYARLPVALKNMIYDAGNCISKTTRRTF